MSPSENGLCSGCGSTWASYDRFSWPMNLWTRCSSLQSVLPSAPTGCAGRFARTCARQASTSGAAVTYCVTVSLPCCSREVPISVMWPNCSGTPASKRHSAIPGSASSDSERSTLVATQPPALMWPWPRSCARCSRKVLVGLSYQSADRSSVSGVLSRHGCLRCFVRRLQTMVQLQLRRPSRRRSRRRRRGGLIG